MKTDFAIQNVYVVSVGTIFVLVLLISTDMKFYFDFYLFLDCRNIIRNIEWNIRCSIFPWPGFMVMKGQVRRI